MTPKIDLVVLALAAVLTGGKPPAQPPSDAPKAEQKAPAPATAKKNQKAAATRP